MSIGAAFVGIAASKGVIHVTLGDADGNVLSEEKVFATRSRFDLFISKFKRSRIGICKSAHHPWIYKSLGENGFVVEEVKVKKKKKPIKSQSKFAMRRMVREQKLFYSSFSREELVNKLFPERKELIESLPMSERHEIQNIWSEMDQMSTIKDFSSFLQLSSKFSSKLQYIYENYSKEDLGAYANNMFAESEAQRQKYGYGGGIDTNFALSGGNSWRFFINPFAMFTFFAENHWGFSSCLNIIESEVTHDGFEVIYPSGTTDAEKSNTDREIKRLQISKLRILLLKHYLTYGNAVILPHFSLLNKDLLLRFEVLIMDRLMPIFDLRDERLQAWSYWIGYHTLTYPKETVRHLCNPSLKYPDIGVPFVSPLMTDIEADMAASSLNNMVMAKAGMIGVVIGLKQPPTATARETDRAVARMNADISNMHSGFQGANTVLISNWIDKVHKLAGIGDFDASFLKQTQEVGRKLATVFRIPVDRLNIALKSMGVYEASRVRDSGSEILDKTIGGDIGTVDNFINDYLLPLAGIKAKVRAKGRFGSMTLNGAQISQIAAQTLQLTENEHLTWFYGLPPHPAGDPRGDKIINIPSLNPTMLPPKDADPMSRMPVEDVEEVPEFSDDADDGEDPFQSEEDGDTEAVLSRMNSASKKRKRKLKPE